MKQIFAIYDNEPPFPASDQHPEAIRYSVDGRYVDAVGGKPTKSECEDLLGISFNALRDAEFNKYRAQRADALDKLAGMTAAAIALDEKPKAALLATLRQGLLDLTSHPTVLAATTLPTLTKAMSDHYKSLVTPLPDALKLEFAKVYT